MQMGRILDLKFRLWMAISMELREQSIAQCRVALDEAEMLASLKKEVA